MTLLLSKLPSFDAEQINLPGLQSFELSAAWLEPYQDDPAGRPEGIPPGPGQLHFGADQEPLSEAPAAPCQLPLLPDPPVWESARPAGPARQRKGRPARKRGNLGLSPGQMSLF